MVHADDDIAHGSILHVLPGGGETEQAPGSLYMLALFTLCFGLCWTKLYFFRVTSLGNSAGPDFPSNVNLIKPVEEK